MLIHCVFWSCSPCTVTEEETKVGCLGEHWHRRQLLVWPTLLSQVFCLGTCSEATQPPTLMCTYYTYSPDCGHGCRGRKTQWSSLDKAEGKKKKSEIIKGCDFKIQHFSPRLKISHMIREKQQTTHFLSFVGFQHVCVVLMSEIRVATLN